MVSMCCIPIANEKDQEEYKKLLDSIIVLAQHEVALVSNGGLSCWDADQLAHIVIPEMRQLLQYLCKRRAFPKIRKAAAFSGIRIFNDRLIEYVEPHSLRRSNS